MAIRDCSEVTPVLKAWLDAELESERAAAIERHVSDCAGCQEIAQDYRRISSALRRAGEVGAPAPRVAAVRADVARARRESIVLTRWLKGVAAAAAVVLVSALALLVWPQKGLNEKETISREIRHDRVLEIVLSNPAWGTEY